MLSEHENSAFKSIAVLGASFYFGLQLFQRILWLVGIDCHPPALSYLAVVSEFEVSEFEVSEFEVSEFEVSELEVSEL